MISGHFQGFILRMTKRIFNFSAGPCTLPLPALEQAAEQLVNFEDSGMSIIEMSHRGPHYDAVHNRALELVRSLLNVPGTYEVLIVQGGASMQFAMLPLNLLHAGSTAQYVNTGYWAAKAIADAEAVGDTEVIWSGEPEGFRRMPRPDEIRPKDDAAYVHVTTNETIGGIEWHDVPDTGSVPLVADASSHIMSRPVDFSKLDLVYAGAQKNLGPAGAALVIISKSLLDKCAGGVPRYLSYRTHASKNSLANTPPVFAIYMMKLVLEWVESQGGVSEMEKRAIDRSSMVYEAIDESDGWYSCPVEKASRSRMNVCFRLPDEELEKKFIEEALESEMSGLKGHRSVGGLRASMYNAMPVAGAGRLADFMHEFRKRNS